MTNNKLNLTKYCANENIEFLQINVKSKINSLLFVKSLNVYKNNKTIKIVKCMIK